MNTSFANTITARNIYPTYGNGQTLGQIPTGVGDNGDAGPVDVSPDHIDNALAVGATGQPLRWWLALIVVLIALMWTSEKYGDGTYGNLKLSAYNIFTVTLAALIGFSLFKLAMVKWPVPGLATIVLAA
jgi:hypothetical protein